jgi:hypothetical protein
MVGGNPVDVRTPFPSLEGWRDQWSYTLFTNKTANSGSGAGGIGPGPFVEGAAGNAEIHEVNGATTSDPARAFRVTLQKMEIQILRKKSGP